MKGSECEILKAATRSITEVNNAFDQLIESISKCAAMLEKIEPVINIKQNFKRNMPYHQQINLRNYKK